MASAPSGGNPGSRLFSSDSPRVVLFDLAFESGFDGTIPFFDSIYDLLSCALIVPDPHLAIILPGVKSISV